MTSLLQFPTYIIRSITMFLCHLQSSLSSGLEAERIIKTIYVTTWIPFCQETHFYISVSPLLSKFPELPNGKVWQRIHVIGFY